jgi:molybdate transport system permease protein
LLVTLPLAKRGILAGVVLSFARAVGEFGATLMLAGNISGKTNTMSLSIYNAFMSGNDELAQKLVLI